uniref:Rho guanine nucleotide exchange factor (GEF) 33 n=1 Tax=Lepisosteus oculatus TaxID=7918 RepID=W5NFK4_LEPOC
MNLQIAELQALAAELKSGLTGALQDISNIQQRDHNLEESMMSFHSEVDEKLLGMRNSLNTFKEELNTALSQIKDINSRQREMQKGLELFQMEVGRELLSNQPDCPHRKDQKEDITADGCQYEASQAGLSTIQHYFASLQSTSSSKVSPEQESGTHQRGLCKSPVWGDGAEALSIQDMGKRQNSALELLESERMYVSYLSLLLKANITFNGSEAVHVKDKRLFPSSLRFLIQQHLELLHGLQERLLRSQWQGIVGDVFMKLASKESDFLDYYVAYLKELPECLSAVNMYCASSFKAASLLEGDGNGDELRPSLHALLLQPVQRIPEYLLLLQNLWKHTEPEHPDYYLLLICIQQFKAFTSQCGQLLLHNEELLRHDRRDLKRLPTKHLFRTADCGVKSEELSSTISPSSALLQRASQVKRSKQKLLDQMQSKRAQDWEGVTRQYDSAKNVSQEFFFSPEVEPRLRSPALQSIPEMEQEHGSSERLPCKGPPPGDGVGEFLLPGEAPVLDSLYEDEDSLHDVSLLDNGSTASSNSSVDTAFARCSRGYAGEACGGGSRLPGRGCTSPEEPGPRRSRPPQAAQRKSKSLNGLQLDGPGGTPSHSPQGSAAGGPHAKLERQSSKGSAPRRAEAERRAAPEEEGLSRDRDKVPLPSPSHQEAGGQVWCEESPWRSRPEDHGQTAFSERSRKQDQKGGFRSSFKKLFKKKSSGTDIKEKANEKPISEPLVFSDQEILKTPRSARIGEIDRGTAV